MTMQTPTPSPPVEDVYRSGSGGYFGPEPVTAADCLADYRRAHPVVEDQQ